MSRIFRTTLFRPLSNYERAIRRLSWMSYCRDLLGDISIRDSSALHSSDLLAIVVLRKIFYISWRLTNWHIPRPKPNYYDPTKSFAENGCWLTAGPFEPGGCFDIAPRSEKPFSVFP